MMNLANYTQDVYYKAFRAGLRPDENLTVSEWADKKRQLSSTASSEPGQWRTSRVPYMREIMDCLSVRHPAERVIFQKGAQVAGTESGLNWIGYVIDQAPGPMMYVTANERMAERVSKTRIQPMIESSAALMKKVRSPRSRDSGNTVMTKEFPGGFLALTGANSPANLRSMPIKYIFFDEVDGYPGNVGGAERGEGDPVELAITRTNTFKSRKKIFLVSTPTIKGISRIERAFLNSDQRRYYVPCPHCKHKQTLQMSNLKYEKNDQNEVTDVFYVCEDCGVMIEEHYKTWMLENGEWRPEKPRKDNKIAGFHLNSLYSPAGWLSWLEIATKWVLAQDSRELLQEFVNTVLGETWEERGEAPAWERLYRQRETYKIGTVPAGGLFLTCGADVQKDRIEYEVVAWGRDKHSFSVTYGVIPGDTSTDAPFDALDMILTQPFRHESGLDMFIMRMGVDSGYNTQQVYGYCRKYVDTLRVLATKGQENLQTPLGHPKAVELSTGGKRMPKALKLWLIGTSMLKSELYRHLRQDPPLKDGEAYPYGYCYFPQYDEEYFKMLTAEQLVKKENKRRFTTYEWQKTRDRNEALDCRIIARAMAASVGYDRMTEKQFEMLEKQLQKQAHDVKINNEQPKPAANLGAAVAVQKRRGMRSSGLN